VRKKSTEPSDDTLGAGTVSEGHQTRRPSGGGRLALAISHPAGAEGKSIWQELEKLPAQIQLDCSAVIPRHFGADVASEVGNLASFGLPRD